MEAAGLNEAIKKDISKKMEDDTWVNVQQKTFTKWLNTHLRRKGTQVNNIVEDFKDGFALMKLINLLYGVPTPVKINLNPRMRVHLIDNVNGALKMLNDSGVKTVGLAAHHLVDGDRKMLLGMIWCTILDYQIKGITVEEVTAKEGLLLWCQKKTHGYKGVKIDNFTTSWQDGLALAALIHRHRPDLINFDSLEKGKGRENLELCFRVAEESLGIARLLDVEDLVDVPRPDERSVMTYISEFFHVFSSLDAVETAGRRLTKFYQTVHAVDEMKQDYERRVNELLAWINAKIADLNKREFDGTYATAKAALQEFQHFKNEEKRHWMGEKDDIEQLLANINTKCRAHQYRTFTPADGLRPEDFNPVWDNNLFAAEKARGEAIGDNLFQVKEKLRKDFAELANKLWDEVQRINSVLKQDHNDALEAQLERLKALSSDVEALKPTLVNLEEADNLCKQASIEENAYTNHSREDLEWIFDKLNTAVNKRIGFIENQIIAKNVPQLSEQQLQEFNDAFHHFDKDNNNTLSAIEFKAVMASLGQSFLDDVDGFQRLYKQVCDGEEAIDFEKFVRYMISITQDTETPEQVRQAWGTVAQQRPRVLPPQLKQGRLNDDQIQYFEKVIPGDGDGLDYKTYLDRLFM